MKREYKPPSIALARFAGGGIVTASGESNVQATNALTSANGAYKLPAAKVTEVKRALEFN